MKMRFFPLQIIFIALVVSLNISAMDRVDRRYGGLGGRSALGLTHGRPGGGERSLRERISRKLSSIGALIGGGIDSVADSVCCNPRSEDGCHDRATFSCCHTVKCVLNIGLIALIDATELEGAAGGSSEEEALATMKAAAWADIGLSLAQMVGLTTAAVRGGGGEISAGERRAIAVGLSLGIVLDFIKLGSGVAVETHLEEAVNLGSSVLAACGSICGGLPWICVAASIPGREGPPPVHDEDEGVLPTGDDGEDSQSDDEAPPSYESVVGEELPAYGE